MKSRALKRSLWVWLLRLLLEAELENATGGIACGKFQCGIQRNGQLPANSQTDATAPFFSGVARHEQLRLHSGWQTVALVADFEDKSFGVTFHG